MLHLPELSKESMALGSTGHVSYSSLMLNICSECHTAFAWYASGLQTLDDVRVRKGGLKLSTSQEIGLKFYYSS
ncbi:hypothetical protein JVU11DRAFT_11392 [Chiua virens]|nr:hypothetical protein JVU11DRAFT_11392 [Chiua virens]